MHTQNESATLLAGNIATVLWTDALLSVLRQIVAHGSGEAEKLVFWQLHHCGGDCLHIHSPSESMSSQPGHLQQRYVVTADSLVASIPCLAALVSPWQVRQDVLLFHTQQCRVLQQHFMHCRSLAA